MADLRPYAHLHSIAVLRDLIRKWWKLELFFVNRDGEPLSLPGSFLSGEAPRPIAQGNDFCRLSLHAPAGARRCAESLRVTLDKVRAAGRAERCLVHACHLGFDVVACSLWLGGELAGLVAVSGLIHEPWTAFGEAQLLRKVREVAPGAGSGTDLERALKRVPFLSRGEVEQLCDLLLLCAEEIQEVHEERERRAPVGEPLTGSSPAVQQLLRQIDQLAESRVPVLIAGEPGTGKERVARALHDRGPQAPGPFVVQRCAIFMQGLQGGGAGAAALAQELLGDGDRPGRLQAAAGGTLLLDEVGALPPPLQLRLRELLDRGALGARLLCTTTVDLGARAAAGAFLPELLDHLPLRLRVPPLRERPEDLPLLCAQLARQYGAPPPPPPVLERLARYPWPGNVRELQAELLRLRDLGPQVDHLSERVRLGPQDPAPLSS